MFAGGQGVKFALDAHRTHLLPDFDGIHRRIAVGVAVKEQHRRRIRIEGKLWHEQSRVVVAARLVVAVGAVGQGIGRIDADAPLHLAR